MKSIVLPLICQYILVIEEPTICQPTMVTRVVGKFNLLILLKTSVNVKFFIIYNTKFCFLFSVNGSIRLEVGGGSRHLSIGV